MLALIHLAFPVILWQDGSLLRGKHSRPIQIILNPKNRRA